MEPNEIYVGDCREVLDSWPDECIDMTITSPPYLQARWYSSNPQIFRADPDCNHDWVVKVRKKVGGSGENANVGANRNDEANMRGDTHIETFSCSICGGWKGELGLQSTAAEYIDDLCTIFDKVHRVTTPGGSLYVNLGEKYGDVNVKDVPNSCVAGVPARFQIEMCDRGWFLRNVLIWHKPNGEPSSVPTKYTVDYECLFWFTKSNKIQYWVNDRTKQVTATKPTGLKGIEKLDWDWLPCSICQKEEEDEPNPDFKQDGIIDPATGKPKQTMKGFNKRYKKKHTKIPAGAAESMGSPRARYHRICKNERCTDGLKPKSLWRSQKYYHNQALEPSKTPGSKHVGGAREYGVKTDIKTGAMRNKRSVWSINTVSYSGAHFAVMASELAKVPIETNCPEEVCLECGLPTVPIFEKGEPDKEAQKACGGNDNGEYHGQAKKDYAGALAQNPSDMKRRILDGMRPRTRVGTAGCTHVLTGAEQEEERQRIGSHPFRTDACTTPKSSVYQAEKIRAGSACCNHRNTRKGIVLDPFGGSGTTAIVARELGREWVLIDVKEEYTILAKERLGLVPEPIPEDQETLGRWL